MEVTHGDRLYRTSDGSEHTDGDLQMMLGTCSHVDVVVISQKRKDLN